MGNSCSGRLPASGKQSLQLGKLEAGFEAAACTGELGLSGFRAQQEQKAGTATILRCDSSCSAREDIARTEDPRGCNFPFPPAVYATLHVDALDNFLFGFEIKKICCPTFSYQPSPPFFPMSLPAKPLAAPGTRCFLTHSGICLTVFPTKRWLCVSPFCVFWPLHLAIKSAKRALRNQPPR